MTGNLRKALILMKFKFIILGLVILIPLFCNATEKRLLDDNWTFQLTDDKGIIHERQTIDLPHDWSIHFDFNENAPAGNDGGYLPTGKGHYIKNLILSPEDLKKNNSLLFEGVYMNSTVIVNGDTIGYRPYGYSTFSYDISPALHEGENIIEVLVDNSQQKNSRWYSGSGIYRHVWLLSSGDVYISPDNLYITTPEVSDESATVNINADLIDKSAKGATVKFIVKDGSKFITQKQVESKGGPISTQIKIENPQLWSPDYPFLYTLEIITSAEGEPEDLITETFGIREFSYSAAEGLKLNGSPIILNGGCVHHDNGLLGAASYDAAEARKVKLLKDAGFNAVRTSHNPPSPTFLYECDRQGLIVIDEAFDGWKEAKTPYDYATIFDDQWEKDITAMVMRDRNHPSIFCWSIGNEILERKSPEAVVTAKNLATLCRELDPSRPVTSALAAWDDDWEIYDPLAAQHDIVGYNYMIHKAEGDHERVPHRIMWQTESYPRDAFQNSEMVKNHPYIIGDFVWTAIDYLGESGIGRHYYKAESEGEHWERNQFPWHASYCGDIDLLGLRKPISYYRKMLYNPEPAIYMAVREPNGYFGEIKETLWGTYPTYENWTWPGHEGKPIEVEIISRYPEVELWVNDKKVGRKPTTHDQKYKAIFEVPYSAGKITAKAINASGEYDEEYTIMTAGAPYAVRLSADKDSFVSDNRDLVYITAEIVDKNGIVVPFENQILEFGISGPGEIIATGSADIKDTDGYTKLQRKTWRGKAGAVVKSTHDPGKIILNVKSEHLPEANLNISSQLHL